MIYVLFQEVSTVVSPQQKYNFTAVIIYFRYGKLLRRVKNSCTVLSNYYNNK